MIEMSERERERKKKREKGRKREREREKSIKNEKGKRSTLIDQTLTLGSIFRFTTFFCQRC